MLDKKSQMADSADYPPPSYRFPVSESDFLGFPFLAFRSDFFARFPKNGGALPSSIATRKEGFAGGRYWMGPGNLGCRTAGQAQGLRDLAPPLWTTRLVKGGGNCRLQPAV